MCYDMATKEKAPPIQVFDGAGRSKTGFNVPAGKPLGNCNKTEKQKGGDRIMENKNMNDRELENVNGGEFRYVNTGDERPAAIRTYPGLNAPVVATLVNGTQASTSTLPSAFATRGLIASSNSFASGLVLFIFQLPAIIAFLNDLFIVVTPLIL